MKAGAKVKPVLELHLSRDVFATGKRLSGVVVLRLSKPTNINSLCVSVNGIERPTGALLAPFRRCIGFFEREILLSGAVSPRLRSDRVSQFWNGLMGRNNGHTLSAGEHAYPFAISIPAPLPPSYEGRAGRIEYRVTARLQPTLGRAVKISRLASMIYVPRHHRDRPVALSYPTADGTANPSEINMNIDLPDRIVKAGEAVDGRFTLSNPHGVKISRIVASIEVREWVRLAVNKEIQPDCVDQVVVENRDEAASIIEGSFSLKVPSSAPPSIDGTAISVIWLLKFTLETDPPIEFKTPITVCAS